VPVDDLAGFAYRRGEDERLYLDSILVSLGRVETRSWTFAVCAAGVVDRELRRAGSGGAAVLV
jgi:hypothetical protein